MVALFAVSRALYYAAGARFDARDLDSMWHFVDPELLREQLLESVWHLHFQPPLFNLYLGVMLKTFGGYAHAAFALGFGALGLGFACALLWLMRACGVGPRCAWLLTGLLVISPALLLYESYLFYSYPVMAMLSAAAVALLLAARGRGARWWHCAFGLLAAVVLTRALFHPGWLLALVLALWWLRPRDRRHVLAGAALPLLLVALWCGKNWVLFDTPGTSSWLGLGLARMTVRNLPAPVRERWVAERHISPLSAFRPPPTLAEYATVRPLPVKTGVAVLDQVAKPSGAINLHHVAYVEISRELGRDARYALLHRPDVYFHAAYGAFRRFVSPAADWHPLARNRDRIAGYVKLHTSLVYLTFALGRGGLVVIALLVLVPFGLHASWRALREDRHDAQGLVLAFISSTAAYVLLAGCLLEPRENMRFRLLVEPFLWLLLGVAIARLNARWRAAPRSAA
jgi:4-amino-4-deoxy-L-arabinose transferase-like glycosyltransferase